MTRRKATHKPSRRQRRGMTSSFILALKRLKKLKASERSQAMNMANATFIRQFCEQLRKLKRAKLSPTNRKIFQQNKKLLQQLANKRTTLSKRRRMLSQSGGGILKSILSAIPIVGTVMRVIDTV